MRYTLPVLITGLVLLGLIAAISSGCSESPLAPSAQEGASATAGASTIAFTADTHTTATTPVVTGQDHQGPPGCPPLGTYSGPTRATVRMSDELSWARTHVRRDINLGEREPGEGALSWRVRGNTPLVFLRAGAEILVFPDVYKGTTLRSSRPIEWVTRFHCAVP